MDNEEKERRKLQSRIEKFRASQQRPKELSPWEGISLLGSLGTVLAVSLVIGIGLGVYLDRKWHTEPWLTLTGLFLGLVAGGFGVYELIRSVLKGKE